MDSGWALFFLVAGFLCGPAVLLIVVLVWFALRQTWTFLRRLSG
jgi:hypothetical protein